MFRFLSVHIFNQKQASFFTWCSDLCLINTLNTLNVRGGGGGEKKKERKKEGGGGGGGTHSFIRFYEDGDNPVELHE